MLYHFHTLVSVLVAFLFLWGKLLRDARRRHGWTIEYAAEKHGVDWTTLSRWERNKQIPHDRNLYKAIRVYQDPHMRLQMHIQEMVKLMKKCSSMTEFLEANSRNVQRSSANHLR